MQALVDGSLLMTEALVRSGADVFIGYPITPANNLYAYSGKRFKTFLAAPDEITALQWMSGFSATGSIPVTATSFPGFALMVESINMAYMMELPMVIVLVQRLGPATGTATSGAQGDLLLLRGMLSGGYSLPVLSTSNACDCWDLANQAVRTAVDLRTPVVLLTSKEEVMTQFSLNMKSLKQIDPVERKLYEGQETYQSYKRNKDLVPAFLPAGNNKHQVRLTGSTHNEKGILEGLSAEALENTRKIHEKIEKNLNTFLHYELVEDPGAEILLISYGITANAAREAARTLKNQGTKVSLLIPKTLIPTPDVYLAVTGRYNQVVIAEENHTGQLMQLLWGASVPENVHSVNKIGNMIDPSEITEEVRKHG